MPDTDTATAAKPTQRRRRSDATARPSTAASAATVLITPAANTVHAPVPDAAPATPAETIALALCAALLDAETPALGAHRLATALAAAAGAERVSVGIVQRGRTALLASSQGEPEGGRNELQVAVIGAMDEALDQGLALSWPLPDGPEDHSLPVLVEQRQLQQLAGGAVASLPLGQGGRRFGAVCIERRAGAHASGPPFTAAELRRIESWLVLAAPALHWLHEARQPTWRRALRDAEAHWARLRRPDKRLRRRMLAVVAVAIAFVALAPLQSTVGGRARIEGAEQRVMAAPTDGFIKTAHVRPGDLVKAGDPLVDLLEADLRLERERWTSQLAQHENAYAAAMARADRVLAATSMARASEAQAQLALVDEQLSRGRITAPFDAQVIQGDLSQQIGAPVRQGDSLITLATTGRQRVIVDVDETDIAAIQVGQQGRLAISSLPWESDALVVERIAPLAKAVEGRNVFEVEARLEKPRTELRPGLLGRADLDSGRMPPLWAWTRHALLRLRVAFWSWVA